MENLKKIYLQQYLNDCPYCKSTSTELTENKRTCHSCDSKWTPPTKKQAEEKIAKLCLM